MASAGISPPFRLDQRHYRAAQHERFTNRGDEQADAHATAQHHQVQEIVLDREKSDVIEEAELRADEPETCSDHHKAQQFIELALLPSILSHAGHVSTHC